ncbi:MAG: Holliday junction resolvase RuvX [Lentisphaerae bacterium]|nr:Holliday junction resolvase RuvX [Lentisphaerota bacterium]
MARILGIDYGRRRVGLAVSDDTEEFAFPHAVLDVHNTGEAVKKVGECCHREGVARIVVGLPLNMDGTHGPMAEEVRQFTTALTRQTGLPVELWDERLTTYSAEQFLIEADMSRQKRKAVRDKVAAQQILQGYLDAQTHNPAKP